MLQSFLGNRFRVATRGHLARVRRGRSSAFLRLEELEVRTVPSASVLDFGNGFNGNALTLNGAVHYDNANLELTDGHTGEAASAFYSTPVHIGSFTTSFSFQLTNAVGEGFTFTIQGIGPGALGNTGGALGYGGIANSVAVKFDLNDNGGEGSDSTGLYTNGATPTLPDINLASTGINLHSGDVLNCQMTYDGSTLIVTEVDATQQADASQSYRINIASLVGDNLAYVGFTASTGSGTAKQEILGWSYTETNLPPDLGVNISNVVSYNQDILFADAMKENGGWGSLTTPWDGNAKVDANGWPLQDAGVSVLGGINGLGGAPKGTYKLIFNGQAAQIAPVACNFTIKNQKYDATTNTTTADLLLNNNPAFQDSLFIAFTGTKRNPTDSPGTGLTNLKVMLPLAPGSTKSYDPSVTFTNQVKSFIEQFSTVRYVDYLATNWNQQVNWSDRLLPGGNQYQAATDYGWEGKGASWEYAVQLANETQTDMWINIPVNASTDYITNVADLIRYGSDGTNPYTAPQSNPVYQGLDPNLKVYVEYSNEVWNPGFSQSQANANAAAAEVKAGGSPLNYDGSTDPTVWTQRRVAEKVVQISNLFRSVFGDAQMGSRIRPLLEWWGGSFNQTAANALNFLNNYYANADGSNHVSTPHPVNYYVWGGGGSWYYGVNDNSGLGEVTVPDGGFETPVVSGAQTNPSGSSWSFTGTAGIVHNSSTAPTAPEGTQAAFIQGTGSFQQNITFPADKIAVSFDAAEGANSQEKVDVFLDNTLLKEAFFTNDFAPSSSNYLGSDGKPVVYYTFSVDATAGAHTLKFVGVGTGTIYIDNVQVEGANPMYNSGAALSEVDQGIESDAQYTSAFGLHLTSYEGGFNLGGNGAAGNDLQDQASLDPRAKQDEIDGTNEFFKDGGELAMVYHSSGNDVWGLADPNIYAQNTPKIQGLDAVLAAPLPAPTIGTALPASVGQSVTVTENQSFNPGINAAALFILNVAYPGVYTVALNGTQGNASGKEHFLVDGQRLAGTVSLPQNAAGNSASLTFTITTPGLHGIAVYVDGPQGITLKSLTLTRSTLTPSLISLVVSGVSSGMAGAADTVTVTAMDLNGNIASGYLGTVHFTSSDAQAVLPADYTFTAADAGVHAFSVALRTVGSQSLTATDTGTQRITGSEGLISISPATASSLVILGFPSATTAGVAGTITVTAMDPYGNTATSYLGTVHFTSRDPQAVLPADYTFTAADAGVHMFSAALQTAGSQSLTATDTITSTIAGSQSGIVVSAAAASGLVILGFPSATTAGVTGTVTLTVIDPYGNTASGYLGTVHFTSSDAQAVLPADYTFTAADAGVHSFSAALQTAGSQSLTATDTVTSTIASSESGIVVSPAAVSILVVSGFPSPTTAGATGTFLVTAQDAYGNTVTGYLGSVHFTSIDGQAVLPADYTFTAADAGSHVFDAILATAGSQSITAIDTVNGSVTGTQAGIVVSPAAAASFLVNAPAMAQAGTAFSITVSVLDAYGNVATDYTGTVTFASSDPLATLPADYTFTLSDSGVVTFNQEITLATVGTQSLTATDTANGITGSATVTVSPPPAPPPGGGASGPRTPITSGVGQKARPVVLLDQVFRSFSVKNPQPALIHPEQKGHGDQTLSDGEWLGGKWCRFCLSQDFEYLDARDF